MMKIMLQRILFVATTALVFLIVFPAVAGGPITLTIIGIPFVYMCLFIPALLTGLTFALLLLVFPRFFKLGTLRTTCLGSIVGSIYMYLLLSILQLDRAAAVFYNPPGTADSGLAAMQIGVQVMFSIIFVCFFLAGGASAILIQGKKIELLMGKQDLTTQSRGPP